MSTLGIGSRVFVGWAPGSYVSPGTLNYVGPGTITDGPFRGMDGVGPLFRSRTPAGHTAWVVQPDNLPQKMRVVEKLLYPLDDGDQTMTEKKEEKV